MNYIIGFIKNLFRKKYDTGLLPDLRLPEDKKKDFLHEEISADSALSEYGKKENVKTYPPTSQYSTLSCVAHANTLNLGIENEIEGEGFVALSPAFFYRYRVGYPSGGMSGDDAGKIAKNIGACKYEMLKTPYNEIDINNVVITPEMIENAKIYRARNYVSISQYNDIDVINSILSQGKAITIMIYATVREWAQVYPTIMDNVSPNSAPIRHAICALPNSGFIENGKRYITIQDSSPFGGISIRYVSEDFIRQRCFYANYFLNLKNEPIGDKPRYTFSHILSLGMNNEDIRNLQLCLAYEGIHPKNACTGLFGGITLKSVNEFQLKYKEDILYPGGRKTPTGIVGMYTIAKLNQLYSK